MVSVDILAIKEQLEEDGFVVVSSEEYFEQINQYGCLQKYNSRNLTKDEKVAVIFDSKYRVLTYDDKFNGWI